MDSLHQDAPTPSDDLSALAWVHEELRKSLDAAHKALNRILKEAASSDLSDMDTLDPAVLRTARQQIHQGVGALEVAGVSAGATLLRTSEALVQKFVNRPHSINEGAVRDIEKASFALLDYISRRLSNKPVSVMALFPPYEALMARVGNVLPRPTDLWTQEWPSLSLEAPLAPPEGVAPRAADGATVDDFETGLLQLLRRNQPEDAVALAGLCSSLAAGASQRAAHRESATWMLASGFLEGLAGRHVPLSIHAKRVLSSLLSQLRVIVKGQTTPSDRLANELLFFCAQASDAPAAEHSVLARVRRTFGLERHQPVDLTATTLGKHDPAWITQALKRVSGAKDGWSAVAAGELLRQGGLNEQFSLVSDSLRRLFPEGDVLADALAQAVNHTVQGAQAPEPSLAMEVATGLLYLEACLEDGDLDHPEQAQRLRRLAQRIAQVSQGQGAEPLEGWMEELYRRVSDRQTIGSVVQELRTALSECEKQIDQFFRDPHSSAPLVDVPSKLQSMRGVLAVLGLDMAAHASVTMREDVSRLLAPDADLDQASHDGVFDRLATNLGALGFLIDMMGVQPALAKSLFTLDEVTGVLSPVMGREKKPPLSSDDPVEAVAQHVHQVQLEEAQAVASDVADALEGPDASLSEVSDQLQKLAETSHVQEQSELAESLAAAQAALSMAQASPDASALTAAREQVAQVLSELAPEPEPLEPEPAFPPQAPLVLETAAPLAQTGLEEDDEMRGIFLDEAREVVADAQAALANLAFHPGDVSSLTAVRRGFHTLKGSSRMVGLLAYGEAAWACEQLYNAWMASQLPASDDLQAVTHELLNHFESWTDAITRRADQHWLAKPVVDVAEALRLHGQRKSLGDVPDAVSVAPADVDVLSEPTPEPAPEPVPQAAMAPEPLAEVTPAPAPAWSAEPVFDLPLDGLNEPPRQALELDWSELDHPKSLEPEAADQPLALLDVPASAGALEPADDPLLADTAPQPLFVDSVPDHELIELDLPQEPAADAEPVPEPVDEPLDEQVKVVGPLRISIPLFNIYLNEADEQSRRLSTTLNEWALEQHQSVPNEAVALAHSLAGNSAAVGYADLSRLARLLEHALMRSQALGAGDAVAAALFNEAADEVRRLLHQFAAGFLKAPSDELMRRLEDHDHEASRRIEALALVGDATELDLDVSDAGDAPSAPPEGRSHLRLVHSSDEPDTAPVPFGSPAEATSGEQLDGNAGQALSVELEGEHTQPTPLGMAEFKALEPLPFEPVAHIPHASGQGPARWEDDSDIDAQDVVDEDLFPIFEEEALELLPDLAKQTRQWLDSPQDLSGASACMRTLHTFKGGARLAGAMHLGELAHRMESTIERLLASPPVEPGDVAPLEARVDRLIEVFEALRQRGAQVDEPGATWPDAVPGLTQAPAPLSSPAASWSPEAEAIAAPQTSQNLAASTSSAEHELAPEAGVAPAVAGRQAPEVKLNPIDWGNLSQSRQVAVARTERDASHVTSQAAVRVRPQLLDRLVNQAGEVSITRTRLQSQVGQIRGSLTDLTDNLDRLRQHLRDIELQAETQVNTRLEAARVANQNFDPLEFDRYTRFQELTRMMAESVNDVATVQRTLQRNLETTEDQLAAQARLTRDLQDDLLRTRMVEFEGLSDRLYRVVRQAAKETGKQVRLDLVGGATEVDRGVLERMTGSFEHLLRNCITHGIELPDARTAVGKDAAGTITVSLRQEGNEVSIEFRDDGAGLNLARIREKAVAVGMVAQNAWPTEAELSQLIFTPGFSTADTVTELAGRGIGMDVVRSEVNAMGGRIETATTPRRGTSFTLVLPLTTAVTKVVMLRCGAITVAVPTHLIELVRRAKPQEVEQAYHQGSYLFGDVALPFYWLGALLNATPRGLEGGRSLPVVLVRSAQQRIAIHVDEVLGNQEVVVKNLGQQLSRLPGLAGMTLLASGAVSLIYNPVALATVYGGRAQGWTAQSLAEAGPLAHDWLLPGQEPAAQTSAVPVQQGPLVLVVDDSLTVRRVTQRLLVREGYRVMLAKDGLEALELLAKERPKVVLSDIEMPRMDGFDLVRNIRMTANLADLPIIMITSRIAQKHRDYAAELGVNHYLGKPYGEEELLALVARYAVTDRDAVH